MTISRSDIVQDGAEGVYHCTTRCVRHAFLCGYDRYSEKSYEDRREWIRIRIKELSGLFAVEVLAYCILSDQLHVVLRTRPDWIDKWSDEETARRWLLFVPKVKPESGGKAVLDKLGFRQLMRNQAKLFEVRQRLQSVSWFMRGLNEYVARRANKEDKVKGRFWEGRFKCRALLDEAALLTCAAYVDLLPIQSGLAAKPDEVVNSSLRERMEIQKTPEKTCISPVDREKDTDESEIREWLAPLVHAQDESPSLTGDEYLELLSWTGQRVADGRKTAIPEHLALILTGFSISVDRWIETVKDFDDLFHRVAGKLDSVKAAARSARKSWLKGLKAGQDAFSK